MPEPGNCSWYAGTIWKISAVEVVVGEVAVNAAEQKIRNSGNKLRMSIVLVWINESGISYTKNVNSLIDTGSEIKVINTHIIGEQCMPLRHGDTKMRIIGAYGQRLRKSVKMAVTRVDLRIQDASNDKARTFKSAYIRNNSRMHSGHQLKVIIQTNYQLVFTAFPECTLISTAHPGAT